jgi:uncharacterized protein (UPF0335 family)
MNPSTETSVADDQLAAFIDRILRMKEEADAIAADIREIYAEAKANGFDKTQLGNVITYLRKKDKDAAKFEEGEAVFDLYLGSYLATKNRAPRVRAYARASNGPEITEPQEAQAPAQAGHASPIPDAQSGAGNVGNSLPGTESAIDRESITEPQPAPQVEQGSDVAAEPVASRTIQPETANEAGGEISGHAVQPVAAGHSTATTAETTDGGSDESEAAHPVPVIDPGRRLNDSKTHTAEEQHNEVATTSAQTVTGEGAPNASVTPIYAAPGVVVMETCPPEGALAHPYAACWPVRDIDVSEGVREPIVKIGKLILDGRGRMFASRGWDGGKGREYPVVQYDGTDPLMDCIRWNLASRPGIHSHNLKLIAGKLAKLEPTRADEIMQAFGLEVAEAAQ